jgi:uncharacterized protein
MSVTNKSVVFLALAFAISWAIAIGGHFTGMSANPQLALPALAAMMTGPAIAAVICALLWEKGRRVDALGLRFRANMWWLFAWLIPLAIAAASVAATLLLSDRSYADIGAASAQIAQAQGQDLSTVPPLLISTPFILGMSIVLGALINAPILTFTEELGWRGYLHDLWRPSGFWRASLATGFVWGVWHAPAIYFYGLNYPDNAVLGVGLFTLYCMLLSPLLTLVRDRGGSTWAAGIFHGTINAIGGLTMMMINQPTFPWNGIAGIGGFIALALGCALILLLQRKPAAA